MLVRRFFTSGQGLVNVVFKSKSQSVAVSAECGKSILAVAHENGIDLEGACEASLACSTCHVILDAASFKKLKPPTDEENDLLDLAFGLSDTSRLGCQVELTRELEGMQVTIPAATRNISVGPKKAQ